VADLLLHVGIDDFDSPSGGCTTHLAARIAWELARRGLKLVDYPNLIRLNPSVPWKTRGNGAVALRLESEISGREILGIVEGIAQEYAAEYDNPKQQPAIAVLEGSVPEVLTKIAYRAVGDLIPVETLERVLEKLGRDRLETRILKGKRGLVGAVAAIGVQNLEGDFTYEAIFYRTRDYIGKARMVDAFSVAEAEARSRGELFLNYDPDTGRLLATPHGPDPILMGIRGENPTAIQEALKTIRVKEPVEAIVLFRTNQHTDQHLQEIQTVCQAHPYRCVRVKGFVSKEPVRIPGGHVIFRVSDGECSIDVAAYEPTKGFRDLVSGLTVGDEVEVMGCVRPGSPQHPPTLNLEKIRVIRLTEVYKFENPICPRCGSRMTSAGRGKGFKCPKCGYKSRDLTKIRVKVERTIKPGFYQPPKHAFKHLMKPVERYGLPVKSFSYHPVNPFIKPPA
jgi:tRNA(Ile2)-agmatinylcytidine synthase